MTEDVEMKDADPEVLGFGVLQFIKTAQSQHGLRHSDYARYRQYCTKKLHRSRKTLKLQQGKGKFTRRALELSEVSSNAHLQLPLICAERDWAFAMESKGKLDGEKAAEMRQSMLRRLSTAASHAAEFSRLAAARCDARTSLEAEAYAAHMSGLHLVEHPDRKPKALAKLQRARKLCEELARVGTFEQQAVAQQRLEEVEPAARFAEYQLKKEKVGGEEMPSSPTTPKIKAQLSALAMERKEPASAAGKPADGPIYLQWRGGSYPVHGERLKGFVNQALELASQLEGGPLESTEQLTMLEKLVVAYSEAKSVVRHSLATIGGAGGNAADDSADLKALNVAVSGRQLECNLQKNSLAARRAQAELDSKGQPDSAKTKRSKGKKARGGGPLAVVRLYDTLLQNLKELTEVAGQLGGAAGEYMLDECAAKTAEMMAQRCFFVARSYLSDGKPRDAHALFAHARQRALEAVSKHEECAKPDASAMKSLEDLSNRCGAWRVVAHAKALEAGEKAADGVRELKLVEEGQSDVAVKYLMDDLDSWKSYAGGNGEPPKLAPIPPRLQPIPVRPFLLDCALNYIQPPDLTARIPKQEKTSTIGRIFGWGATK